MLDAVRHLEINSWVRHTLIFFLPDHGDHFPIHARLQARPGTELGAEAESPIDASDFTNSLPGADGASRNAG
jgi:hypothetical protein